MRPVSRVAPPRNVASGFLRSDAGWSAWVACAHLWTLRESAASARGQAGALRRAPAADHGCPIENALLASVRPVVLLAGRSSSALERQVPSRPQPPSPVLPAQRGTLHAQSRLCRRLLPTAHRCPIDNALLASVRPVVLLAGRSSSALERQVPSCPQPPLPVLPARRGTLHAQSRPCRRLPPVP